MKEILFLVDLIRASLYPQQKISLSLDGDVETLQKCIMKQQLITLVGPILERQDGEEWKPLVDKLHMVYNHSIHKALTQQIKIEQFLNCIEDKGMDCLPLKGWIMKGFYADSTFRSMTDFDVLLKDFDTNRVQDMMEGLGYEPNRLLDDHHEVYIQKPHMVVEVHKTLSDEQVEKDMPQVDAWLRDIWKLCVLENGKKHIYKLRQEDVYIYHIIHLSKHFQLNGTGIRPIIDIYVFLDQVGEQLDWDYIQSTLENMSLREFENVMRSLSKKCFAPEKNAFTEDELLLLEFMLSNGMFGDRELGASIMVAKEKEQSHVLSRVRAIGQVVFRPASILKDKYPILEKYPIFLPVIWVVRCFRIVLKERYKMTAITEGSSQEKTDEVRKVFRIAGLNIEEKGC